MKVLRYILDSPRGVPLPRTCMECPFDGIGDPGQLAVDPIECQLLTTAHKAMRIEFPHVPRCNWDQWQKRLRDEITPPRLLRRKKVNSA